MDLLSNRRFQVTIFSALFITCVINAIVMYICSHNFDRSSHYREMLPPEGLAENETNGTVPGDPENGRSVLRNLFRFVSIYKQLHNKFPSIEGDLTDDISKNPTAYGVHDVRAALTDLINPDNRYADDFHSDRARKFVVFMLPNKRPDGTTAFGPRPIGTKDVLSYSDMYVYQNRRQFPRQRTTLNPVGFYQVLWDDGKIEEIPYDKVRFVLNKRPNHGYDSLILAFPGQAGVPTDALSYDDYWTKVNRWKQAPRGKAGSKGIAFNGQSYR